MMAYVLRGAEQIAKFPYGDPGARREVYHLAENSRLSVFQLKAVLCAATIEIDGVDRAASSALGRRIAPTSDIPTYVRMRGRHAISA